MRRTILALDCSQRTSMLVVARGPIVSMRVVEPIAAGTQSGDREPFWDALRELCALSLIHI